MPMGLRDIVYLQRNHAVKCCMEASEIGSMELFQKIGMKIRQVDQVHRALILNLRVHCTLKYYTYISVWYTYPWQG